LNTLTKEPILGVSPPVYRLNDPALRQAPQRVDANELLLAWMSLTISMLWLC
jgi:hypothetical protein